MLAVPVLDASQAQICSGPGEPSYASVVVNPCWLLYPGHSCKERASVPPAVAVTVVVGIRPRPRTMCAGTSVVKSMNHPSMFKPAIVGVILNAPAAALSCGVTGAQPSCTDL